MTTTEDRNLIRRWIRPQTGAVGDQDAVIVDTGIPIWALIGHYKGNGKHASLTASDYELPIEAVEAAVAYYRAHRELIEARLSANDRAGV
jgi:uncharacterized protein (DUF433 family)